MPKIPTFTNKNEPKQTYTAKSYTYLINAQTKDRYRTLSCALEQRDGFSESLGQLRRDWFGKRRNEFGEYTWAALVGRVRRDAGYTPAAPVGVGRVRRDAGSAHQLGQVRWTAVGEKEKRVLDSCFRFEKRGVFVLSLIPIFFINNLQWDTVFIYNLCFKTNFFFNFLLTKFLPKDNSILKCQIIYKTHNPYKINTKTKTHLFKMESLWFLE